ncbi:hypothetical protein [Turneriella parva]|uniref:Uncharacterized protein n=1 Tax=Turneriella parva (strain ATCC BAA-1111 / DSM 21527 / NCTC 11395 / H) TaxID=869212 RepID=I4BA87_TURPD|nr:hypothetical protein [Turneriella parva]AFM14194.1 hypothetical protein Turpa_3559 [Turneriella parva DSM 21527]
MHEQKLYPIVARWLKTTHKCFKVGVNTGLSFSRIDVIGVRDTGGDLSGEIETISVEVKRGTEPFATASGQAFGYNVYANRVYLADYRRNGFSRDELDIAGHLGIGLIQIKNRACLEVLSSPRYMPIPRLNLLLLEKLCLGKCTFCNSMFEIGKGKMNLWSKMIRENLPKAITEKKGLTFWNRELAKRKALLGVRSGHDEITYERRFICPDCITNFFARFDITKNRK